VVIDVEAQIVDKVRRIWEQVLDVPSVPLDVSFFRAGGDSLLLILLLEELNALAGGDLDAADLFQHTTVLEQADLIVSGRTAIAGPAVGPGERTALFNRARREPQDTP
jgi:hypothetical protein